MAGNCLHTSTRACTLSVIDVGGLTSKLRPAMDTLATVLLTAVQNQPDAMLSKLRGVPFTCAWPCCIRMCTALHSHSIAGKGQTVPCMPAWGSSRRETMLYTAMEFTGHAARHVCSHAVNCTTPHTGSITANVTLTYHVQYIDNHQSDGADLRDMVRTHVPLQEFF